MSFFLHGTLKNLFLFLPAQPGPTYWKNHYSFASRVRPVKKSSLVGWTYADFYLPDHVMKGNKLKWCIIKSEFYEQLQFFFILMQNRFRIFFFLFL